MHCPTCTCEPKQAVHLCVYPANAKVYGTCGTCGQPRWQTACSRWSATGGWSPKRSDHCGCCTHPHDLPNGGHEFTLRAWKVRQPRANKET